MIAEELQKDIEDLRMEVPEVFTTAAHTNQTEAWWAGTLYVLEGSSVGARLLIRRAQALGLSGDFEARHLAAQTEQREAWPTFLALMEQSSGIDIEAAGEAAKRAFVQALDAFSGRGNFSHR